MKGEYGFKKILEVEGLGYFMFNGSYTDKKEYAYVFQDKEDLKRVLENHIGLYVSIQDEVITEEVNQNEKIYGQEIYFRFIFIFIIYNYINLFYQ